MDAVTKPGMKSYASGTLDLGLATEISTRLGVSCSLWKGSSGGPCVVLDGASSGGIVGLGKNFYFFLKTKAYTRRDLANFNFSTYSTGL